MENSSTVIAFNSDPNDIPRTEFIESGEGELLRTFRCSVEVRTALHQASVGTTAIEDEIDGLDEAARYRFRSTLNNLRLSTEKLPPNREDACVGVSCRMRIACNEKYLSNDFCRSCIIEVRDRLKGAYGGRGTSRGA